MKILLIRFSSIGDLVLTTPLYRCLKQQMPEAEIHLLTKAAYEPVIKANPYIDRLHLLHDDLTALTESLRAEKFDYLADLHHNLRTLRLKQALGVKKTFSFPKKNAQKWLLTNLKINMLPDESIVDRYFETLKPLGIRNDGQGLDYFIPEEEKVRQDDIPFGHWAGYVACVIGGSYNTKKLPVAQWIAFCKAMPYPVILLGGPEDRADGEQITASEEGKIYNACGKFNLNESADLVRRSRVVVSNDTGLMHVAAAFKKPVVSLWGNTVPEMGMFPYYGFNNLKSRVAPQSVLMEIDGLRCRPCSKLGYNTCPRGHFKCMNSLDMKLAAATVQKMWTAA